MRALLVAAVLGASGLAIAAAGAPPAAAAAAPRGVSAPTGYWLAGADGGVFAFGTAGFYGSMGGHPLASRIVGIAPAPDRAGYWLVAGDGGVFSQGSAAFVGSSGCINPAQPCGGSNSFTDGTIAGLAPTPSGHGYWMVDSNGNVFAFGDAPFLGSSGCINPAKACGGVNSFTNSGIIGITQTPDGGGYWLAAQHGSVFAFGDAVFAGSSACANPAQACGPGNSFAVTDIIGMTS